MDIKLELDFSQTGKLEDLKFSRETPTPFIPILLKIQTFLMNNSRPDYIKCIQHTHVDLAKTSWCGKKLYSYDWVFQDIDHAVYSIQQDSRQVPCPDCLKKIYEVLDNA